MTNTSLKQAAATLGIHRNTLSEWIDKGCPAAKRADRPRGEWQMSIPAIFDWRQDYVVREAVAGYNAEAGHITKDEADRRRAVAMAVMAEVEADTIIGSVVRVTDAAAANAAFCQVLKSGLENASHRIAGRATTITSAPVIQEMCEHEFNRAFATAKAELARQWTLATTPPPGPDEAGEGE